MADKERVDNWLRGLKAQEDLPGTTLITGPLSMLRRVASEVDRLRQASQQCAFGWEDDARCLEDPDVPPEKYCVLCARRAAKAKEGETECDRLRTDRTGDLRKFAQEMYPEINDSGWLQRLQERKTIGQFLNKFEAAEAKGE